VIQPSIKDLILAAYPCLFLETLDAEGAEVKIREALREIRDEKSRVDENGNAITTQVGVWSLTSGLLIGGIDQTLPKDLKPSAKNFPQVLEFLKNSTESYVIVCHNIREMFKQMLHVQLLIDAAMAARSKYSTIIFVGQGFDWPPELQNIVQYCDFPLPTRSELIDLCLDKLVLPNAHQFEDLNIPKLKEIKGSTRAERIATARKQVRESNFEILDAAAKSACGLDPLSAENAFALSVTMTGRIDANIIQEQKRQAIRQSDVLEFIPIEDTMDHVGGFGEYKTWLKRRSKAFTDEAAAFGVSPPKGTLFCGFPGTGKSLAAKASASVLGLPLLRFDMSKVFGSLVGQSEHRMRNALRVTEAIAPCVLWIDELEKGIAGSRSSADTDSGVSSRVVGQFLSWRQETKAGVFLVCTCNNVLAIPPEFYRPGRIDAIFATGLPDAGERVEILAIHLRRRKKSLDDVDLLKVADRMQGFTGAEIEETVKDAIFRAFDKGKAPVDTELLMEAAEDVVTQAQQNKEELEAIEQWANERARRVSSGVAVEAKKARKIARKLHVSEGGKGHGEN